MTKIISVWQNALSIKLFIIRALSLALLCLIISLDEDAKMPISSSCFSWDWIVLSLLPCSSQDLLVHLQFSERVTTVSQSYWVSFLLIGASYRSLEALQYNSNARDVSHQAHYQMRAEMMDGWIQNWDEGEAYQQRQAVPHLIRFKHHLSVYQIVLIGQLLILPLLSRGAAPLNPEVYSRVLHYPTSPVTPQPTQDRDISALGPKVYSV